MTIRTKKTPEDAGHGRSAEPAQSTATGAAQLSDSRADGFADNRAVTVAQHKLAELAGRSSRVTVQRALNQRAQNPPEGSVSKAMAPRGNGRGAATVQRVVYKGTPYKMGDKEFLLEAKTDLGKAAEDVAVNAALSAIAAHDESAVIKDVEALRKMLTLTGNDDETGIGAEVDKVRLSTTVVEREVAGSVEDIKTVNSGNVIKVGASMGRVEGEIGKIEAIPVQDNSLGVQRGNAGFVRTNFQVPQEEVVVAESSVPSVKPKKSKPIKPKATPAEQVTPKLNALDKWAKGFPQSLITAAVRWHALGSLGASGNGGQRHLNIGPKTQTEKIATGGTAEKHGTLWSSPWSPGVNAEWIKAGTDNALDFHLTTAPTEAIAETLVSGDAEAFELAAKKDSELHEENPLDSIYWNTKSKTLTRLGTEIKGLLEQGYRLVVE